MGAIAKEFKTSASGGFRRARARAQVSWQNLWVNTIVCFRMDAMRQTTTATRVMGDDDTDEGKDGDDDGCEDAPTTTTTTTTRATTRATGDDDDDGADGAEDVVAAVVMSKSAMKRARRQEYAETRKRQRREDEKGAKTKEREARKAAFEAKIATMGDEEREAFFARGRAETERKRAEDKAKREARKAQLDSEYNCLIDCEFSELMIDKESKSMCHQMRFVYEKNCKTPTPMKLTFTGIQGAFAADVRKFVGGFDNWHVITHEKSIAEAFNEQERASLVYLTPDSDVELSTLEREKTYVIGGFVDRNRHKLLTLNKAKELGIAHARLPIKDHLKLLSSSVLTVNQTFDILVNYLERGDWSDAVTAVVPTRKTAGQNTGEHKRREDVHAHKPQAPIATKPRVDDAEYSS